ncbi:GntP family permease [Maledivibacter halophilus]|uniref:Gluconate:H+ symporter, GntP family n=1 Tax=Maledivibacter halophilus TaxID=36842 RepID=A0A1T5MDQ5_9FIRM|nr:gluconate:H+ symporter [Maledivibacter halophilus]SKC86114.1 gluconate:H+ symporter, GntP family [Maledivibacter halophilus]
MSGSMVLLMLFLTIGLILLLILKLKLNPAVSLVLGALFMGISCKISPNETIGVISAGFGGTMTGVGLSVGFGVMIGQLIAETGGVQVIANKMLSLVSKEKSDYALGLTGLAVSIPVFYDVGYVILMPLARSMSKVAKTLPYFAGALVAGLGIAHTFIPPTPGPMTGSEILGLNIGTTLLWGLIVAIPTFFLSLFVYEKFFLSRKNFWKPEVDEDKSFVEETVANVEKTPGFLTSITPILLPVLLILLGTVTKAINGEVPEVIQFISNKNIALLIGLIFIFFVSQGYIGKEATEKAIGKALGNSGVVLLITGAGGALGNVLKTVGVGDILASGIAKYSIPAILFVWLTAALLKFAQGSGTVAMITAASLIAPAASSLGVNPVLLALAAFSGTLMAAHVNDSGFWITAKIAGLTTSGGLKTYTLVCAIEAVISLVFIYILSIFI